MSSNEENLNDKKNRFERRVCLGLSTDSSLLTFNSTETPRSSEMYQEVELNSGLKGIFSPKTFNSAKKQSPKKLIDIVKHNMSFKKRRESLQNPRAQILSPRVTTSNPTNLLTKDIIEYKIKNDPLETKRRLNKLAQGIYGNQRMGHDNSVPTFANLNSPVLSSRSIGDFLVEDDNSDVATPRRKTVTHRSRSSNNFNEDDFDFAIVLSPSAEYALWANELDFRSEIDGDWEGIRVGISVGLDSDNKKVFLQKQTCFEAAVDTPQKYDKDGFISPNSKKIKWGSQLTSPSALDPSAASNGDADDKDLEAGGGAIMKSVSSPPLMRIDYSDVENADPNNSVDGWAESGRNHVKLLKEKRDAIEKKLKSKKNGGGDGGSTPTPKEIIPVGIQRKNMFQDFLKALFGTSESNGIVLKRHFPNSTASYVRIYVLDTDTPTTIYYAPIEDDLAKFALQKQKINFGSLVSRTGFGNFDNDDDGGAFGSREFLPAHMHKHTKPSYMASFKKNMKDHYKKLFYSGHINTSTIMAVHPAKNEDPFHKGETGTKNLRSSKSHYNTGKSFSLILSSPHLVHWQNKTPEDPNAHFAHGNGSHSFDLEAETEGTYWLVFRGFLQLQREMVRMAAQRTVGGDHSQHIKGIIRGSKKNAMSKSEMRKRRGRARDTRAAESESTSGPEKGEEKQQQAKRGLFKRILTSFRKYGSSSSLSSFDSEKEDKPAAPPPDYFLGFNSPGTQIWARLRQAGLEGKRVYSLDTSRVMLKLRCPEERLEDVAEVLKMKLKTRDGSYVAFRESIRKKFTSVGDKVSKMDEEKVLFRSSERQKIIDFIARSRIRDSGAELGERTTLGKHVEMRVPLHMHKRLEGLYTSWVTYWSEVNWRDEKKKEANGSATRGSMVGGGLPLAVEQDIDIPPSFFVRLMKGSLNQPLDNVASYFGEGVAFYFAWLEHSSKWLILPAFLGLVQFVVQMCLVSWDPPSRPFFAIFIILWSFAVMVSWRQRSNFLGHRWGTLNYEEEETTRPQYHGDYVRCPITQEWVVHYPAWKRYAKCAIGLLLTFSFTAGALIFMLMAYANRDIILARYFNANGEDVNIWDFSLSMIGKTSNNVASVSLTKEHLLDKNLWLIMLVYPTVLGMMLPLINFFFTRLAFMLNDFENYRTDTEYRNHLILKVFSFRFVNYFAALYYYAFLTTDPDNSIFRVASGILVYITVAHWWNILITIYFPLLLHRWKLYKGRVRLRDRIRQLDIKERKAEAEGKNVGSAFRKKQDNMKALLNQAQSSVWEETMLPEHDGFDDFVYAVIQFAYVANFSAVMPLTPLIVLINNLIQIRLDAYKLCRARRRPLATKAGGIGVWEHVLHIVTVLAVLTNCALMATTSSFVRRLIGSIGEWGLLMVVVGWEHLMLLVKYWMQTSISIYPQSVKDDMKRQKFTSTRKRQSAMRAKKERRSVGEGRRSGDKKGGRSEEEEEIYEVGMEDVIVEEINEEEIEQMGGEEEEVGSVEEEEVAVVEEEVVHKEDGGVVNDEEEIGSPLLKTQSPRMSLSPMKVEKDNQEEVQEDLTPALKPNPKYTKDAAKEEDDKGEDCYSDYSDYELPDMGGNVTRGEISIDDGSGTDDEDVEGGEVDEVGDILGSVEIGGHITPRTRRRSERMSKGGRASTNPFGTLLDEEGDRGEEFATGLRQRSPITKRSPPITRRFSPLTKRSPLAEVGAGAKSVRESPKKIRKMPASTKASKAMEWKNQRKVGQSSARSTAKKQKAQGKVGKAGNVSAQKLEGVGGIKKWKPPQQNTLEKKVQSPFAALTEKEEI